MLRDRQGGKEGKGSNKKAKGVTKTPDGKTRVSAKSAAGKNLLPKKHISHKGEITGTGGKPNEKKAPAETPKGGKGGKAKAKAKAKTTKKGGKGGGGGADRNAVLPRSSLMGQDLSFHSGKKGEEEEERETTTGASTTTARVGGEGSSEDYGEGTISRDAVDLPTNIASVYLVCLL